MNKKKDITLGISLIPIICLILFLFIVVFKYKASPHIALIGASAIAALVAVYLGYTWSEIEKGILKSINMGMQAIIILMIIGTIIGTWILSGVVPTMIYYGLQILSPSIFLVATAVICAIVALSTGSSWTTVGTVGIALIGVGKGLGMPDYMIAGAIISGSYFGDKMSPLSDTTNLAPAMAGTNLFDHVRHMVYTTGPAFIIALILYGVIGIKYSNGNVNSDTINLILNTLNSSFNINIFLLLPPVLVIALVIFKVPAIPGLIGGTVIGGIFAVIFQGAGLKSIITSAQSGFLSETGVKVVDELLTRGGLDSMMGTVSLILCALTFGGILESTGMLETIAQSILKFAKGTGSLILVTIVSCIFANLVTGDQYLSIVVPGRMYKDAYRQRRLHPKNLSRTLEDAGTLTSSLIPWNTCGAYMSTTLGVSPLDYLPWAFLNIINPIIAVIYGYLGFTIEYVDDSFFEDEIV
ncbi:Na+/H+ antiporter NhaC [Tepidibacter thalassicus]|uniref:Na+:H+ antiporter, NhaC family n=1 Tax=Tepidibacter thalassicus DSM 15285 TaxID=1123350 RepID=A0A1M5RNX6_9FIRM|nr:Na+/H+ antiporter NhaC [Tepidibacter thalassicus]SHH28067.1 Na+:H+ antiporter, NhaC family [Tepidibacter thalassicus DSM 15285]